MAFKLIYLVILCIGGCNAGIVPQHFMSNHTEPVVNIERVPTNLDKNESNSTIGILKDEISNITIGNEDLHNSSEVPIVGFHNISKELNLTMLNVSGESHHAVNNHSKEFGHSQKSNTKGRFRKKPPKGSNRFKKNISKETKNFDKVTKGHFNKDSLNESHHLKDSTNDMSHPDKDFSKKSDYAGKPAEDRFKDLLNGSHHAEDFVKGSNHFDKDVSKTTNHVENIRNINFNQSEINTSDNADEIVDHLNHFNNSLNESHHQDILTQSDSDVSRRFHGDDIGTKPVHQLEQNAPRHFEDVPKTENETNGFDNADAIVDHFNHFNNLLNESNHQDVLNQSDSNVSKGSLGDDSVIKPVHLIEQTSGHIKNVTETGNETLKNFETIRDFQMHFNGTSSRLDGTAENFKITDDSTAFLHHADNVSEDINLRHDPSALNAFQEDNRHKKDVKAHSENPASEIQRESFNSTEIVLNDTERLSFGIDIRISSTNENSNFAINQTLLDVLQKEDNSTLINPELNETHSDDAYVMFTVSPNEEDTNSSTELSHGFLRELEVNTNESKLNTETVNDSNIMAVEKNETSGLFSGINFNFLLNSELAKNAASAMEVFNFTDSALTDHIMDDNNDVHNFLDLIHPPVEGDQSDSNEFQGNLRIRGNLNGSEIETGLNSSTSEDGETLKITTTVLSQTLLNSTVDFEETTVSQHLLNSTVQFEEPTTITAVLNSTVEFEETTIVPILNSTVEFVDTVCPPPGICIFWFLAQDTCAVNNHCLGSRICCRIGCAKTCIEV